MKNELTKDKIDLIAYNLGFNREDPLGVKWLADGINAIVAGSTSEQADKIADELYEKRKLAFISRYFLDEAGFIETQDSDSAVK